MRKFPKFLKSMPEFFGLGFPDLVILMMILFFSMAFNFSPMKAILLSIVGISIFKILRLKVDLVGWCLPRKKVLNVENTSRGEK